MENNTQEETFAGVFFKTGGDKYIVLSLKAMRSAITRINDEVESANPKIAMTNYNLSAYENVTAIMPGYVDFTKTRQIAVSLDKAKQDDSGTYHIHFADGSGMYLYILDKNGVTIMQPGSGFRQENDPYYDPHGRL